MYSICPKVCDKVNIQGRHEHLWLFPFQSGKATLGLKHICRFTLGSNTRLTRVGWSWIWNPLRPWNLWHQHMSTFKQPSVLGSLAICQPCILGNDFFTQNLHISPISPFTFRVKHDSMAVAVPHALPLGRLPSCSSLSWRTVAGVWIDATNTVVYQMCVCAIIYYFFYHIIFYHIILYYIILNYIRLY